MTAKDFYQLEDFDLFIAEAEEKWLTFSTEEERVTALFGNVEKGLELYKRHLNN